jgi:phage anti-repressor protein
MELIKIEQRNGIETVNARDLHLFLESKRHFSDWIKQKIENYGFIENQDFTIHKIVIGKNSQNDYYISMSMAKEISMLENNEKGKQARQYFIECEKKVKSTISIEEKFTQALNIFTKTIETLDKRLSNIENKVDQKPANQIENKIITKQTAKEFYQSNNYKSYGPEKILKLAGRSATNLSKELNRQIGYKYENGFDVGCYDIDILTQAFDCAFYELEKTRNLFN